MKNKKKILLHNNQNVINRTTTLKNTELNKVIILVKTILFSVMKTLMILKAMIYPQKIEINLKTLILNLNSYNLDYTVKK